jgi:hypothetical protein
LKKRRPGWFSAKHGEKTSQALRARAKPGLSNRPWILIVAIRKLLLRLAGQHLTTNWSVSSLPNYFSNHGHNNHGGQQLQKNDSIQILKKKLEMLMHLRLHPPEALL